MACFRVFYLNRYEVAPGLYRSAQPTPRQLARFARPGRALAAVVYLARGARTTEPGQLEKEASTGFGLNLEEFVVRFARCAGSVRPCWRAAGFLPPRSNKPALIHCQVRSGPCRFSYRPCTRWWWRGVGGRGASPATLPRYGHFRYARTGILDRLSSSAIATRARREADSPFIHLGGRGSTIPGRWSGIPARRLFSENSSSTGFMPVRE